MIRRRHRLARVALTICLAAQAACGRGGGGGANYTVVHRFPHDTAAFTEGLLYSGDTLYESIGLYGRSQVRREDLATGRVLASAALASDRFGEGLALLHGKLYQLTWKSGVGYVYDARSLARVDSFHFAGQGWGLTTDGTVLIMDNGTDSLRFFDPATFATVRRITVHDKGEPLSALNELEYVKGDLFANVYQSNWIVRIDPKTGNVLQWIDLTNLLPPDDRTPDTGVLNGIAFDPQTGDLLVTGKQWPALYEIHVTPPAVP
jgi:glutaminyl-peptide cyclotransferase